MDSSHLNPQGSLYKTLKEFKVRHLFILLLFSLPEKGTLSSIPIKDDSTSSHAKIQEREPSNGRSTSLHIVVKGAPRLQVAQRHPPTPRLKAGNTPSQRLHLGAQGATRSTGAPRSPISFFSFSFLLQRRVAEGKEKLYFFILFFLRPKQRRFGPF